MENRIFGQNYLSGNKNLFYLYDTLNSDIDCCVIPLLEILNKEKRVRLEICDIEKDIKKSNKNGLDIYLDNKIEELKQIIEEKKVVYSHFLDHIFT
jgi:hypothetical protein